MMANFLIAPDFPPEHFAGWHLLNTSIQRHSRSGLHLLTPSSAAEQNEMIAQDIVDVIYANPFDAAKLVREKGYLPVVKPVGKSDEMVIASGADSAIKKLSDLKPGMKIALTNNYDVRLIGLRLLEAVDLTEGDLEWVEVQSFQAAARMAIRGEVDAAFFVSSAYHSLSRLTLERLHLLIESHLADVIHVILMHPRKADRVPLFQQVFVEMKNTEGGQRILDELHMGQGFEILTQEDTEFMIDLMDTLLD
ncbi:MAG: PhnD/SsuA/transferrin family substrate-binding protein [Neisseria sp.]|nr:PhnD/SsuA/transferrin family substrate-binding protein [Neisseria sp.]